MAASGPASFEALSSETNREDNSSHPVGTSVGRDWQVNKSQAGPKRRRLPFELLKPLDAARFERRSSDCYYRVDRYAKAGYGAGDTVAADGSRSAHGAASATATFRCQRKV